MGIKVFSTRCSCSRRSQYNQCFYRFDEDIFLIILFVDANLISSIKGNALTSMSSVYNDTWESYLAIDGNIGPDPSLCKCCARTNNAAMSWWSIDLGQKYPISSITIFWRNEGKALKLYSNY